MHCLNFLLLAHTVYIFMRIVKRQSEVERRKQFSLFYGEQCYIPCFYLILAAIHY